MVFRAAARALGFYALTTSCIAMHLKSGIGAREAGGHRKDNTTVQNTSPTHSDSGSDWVPCAVLGPLSCVFGLRDERGLRKLREK